MIQWFVQAMLALRHVHMHNILHRDVTSKNIFLDGKGNVKVCSIFFI